MWLIAAYEATTLFSLKPSNATSSGGRSLLVPTPFAIKMALLDAACRTHGVGTAANIWGDIRAADVAVLPAPRAVVTNLFQRVMKPTRADAKKGDEDEEGNEGAAEREAYTRTIGYREYVQLDGPFSIAVSMQTDWVQMVSELFRHIHYLGKRGGFVQLTQPVRVSEVPPESFTVLTKTQSQFFFNGVMQLMDDCGNSLPFEKANIYSGKRITLGKDRLQRRIVLPYQAIRSARSYTLYNRID